MREDPIVKEIHDVRRKLLEESGEDLKRLMQRLKALEDQDKERLISAPPIRSEAGGRRDSPA